MAKKTDKTEDQLASVEQALGKTEQFIENNRKMISYVVGGIVVLVLLVMGYNKYIIKPKELKAFNSIHYAEAYFNTDSFQLALDGDGMNPGFLEIIDDYGNTKSGNLAYFYAGVCYLNLAMNDTSAARVELLENAIDYLDDFSSDDELIQPMAYGAMGDAYDELDEPEKAVKMYMEAANASSNEFSTPLFLMKAGIIYSTLGNHEEALKAFQRIKNEFYTSPEGREIKKYIALEEGYLNK